MTKSHPNIDVMTVRDRKDRCQKNGNPVATGGPHDRNKYPKKAVTVMFNGVQYYCACLAARRPGLGYCLIAHKQLRSVSNTRAHSIINVSA